MNVICHEHDERAFGYRVATVTGAIEPQAIDTLDDLAHAQGARGIGTRQDATNAEVRNALLAAGWKITGACYRVEAKAEDIRCERFFDIRPTDLSEMPRILESAKSFRHGRFFEDPMTADVAWRRHANWFRDIYERGEMHSVHDGQGMVGFYYWQALPDGIDSTLACVLPGRRGVGHKFYQTVFRYMLDTYHPPKIWGEYGCSNLGVAYPHYRMGLFPVATYYDYSKWYV